MRLKEISPPPSLTMKPCFMTIAIVSTVTSWVISICCFSAIKIFIHQTTCESVDIAHPHGDRHSVMVVTRKCLYLAHKPPPQFCPMLAWGICTAFYSKTHNTLKCPHRSVGKENACQQGGNVPPPKHVVVKNKSIDDEHRCGSCMVWLPMGSNDKIIIKIP